MTVFYCDPVNGKTPTSPKEYSLLDGSEKSPWGSLESVIKAKLISVDKTKGLVHAGDELVLLDGYHGTPNFGLYKFEDYLTISAANKHKATINRLTLNKCSYFNIQGLRIESPILDVIQTNIVGMSGENFILENCLIEPEGDVLNWPNEKWVNAPKYGIFCNTANNVVIRYNTVHYTKFGITVCGDNFTVEYNHIDYVANDGLDFTASNSSYSYNLITNHYTLLGDNYHYDAIQGFPYYSDEEKELKNIKIVGNTVIVSTGEYPTIPIPTGVGGDYWQGLNVFDGYCSNFTVENNVIIAAGHHGMSFYGLQDSTIKNNTVVPLVRDPKLKAWLGLFVAKPKYKALPPNNVVVENNIVNTFAIDAKAIVGVKLNKNISFIKANKPLHLLPLSDPKEVFVSYDTENGKYDLRLKDGSPAIGAGTPKLVEKVITTTILVEEPSDIGAIPKE